MSTVPLFDEDEEFQNLKDGVIRTFHGRGYEKDYEPVQRLQPSCYESHPALMIGGRKVYGGSAGWPLVTNADIYVGLDASMKRAHHYPWNDPPTVKSIYYPITDGSAPSDPVEFKKMIVWLAEQLKLGNLIHVGCIGGHGRTGMVLAALVREVDGIEDAITYVRENYCKKAVESMTQVDFLHKHFGITPVQGSRYTPPKNKPMSSKMLLDKLERVERVTSGRPLLSGPVKKLSKAEIPVVAPVPLGSRQQPPVGPFLALPAPSMLSVWGAGRKVQNQRLDKRSKSAKMKSSQEGA